MYSNPSRQNKYLKFATTTDATFQPAHLTAIKRTLTAQGMRFQVYNPLLSNNLPPLTPAQLTPVLLYAAKKMEEVDIQQMKIHFLGKFTQNYHEQLLILFKNDPLLLSLFGILLLKLIQHKIRTRSQINIDHIEPFIKILATVLEQKLEEATHKGSSTQGEQKTLFHYAFKAYLVLASARHLSQNQEQDHTERKEVDLALKACCICVYNVQNEAEFQVLRGLLAVTAHLLVFNGLKVKPISLVAFCLQNNQGLCFGQDQKSQKIDSALLRKYQQGLQFYMKLDKLLHTDLIKMIHNLLKLQISSPMLQFHFQLLLYAIKDKSFSPINIKQSVFEMLKQSQSKKNIDVIDQLFLSILNCGVDILDQQLQRLSLQLVQGSIQSPRRQVSFAKIYYLHYQRNPHRMLPDTVNAIFRISLQHQLRLDKVQLFVKKQAYLISSRNMQLLLQSINNTSSAFYLTLFEIILQIRKERAFRFTDNGQLPVATDFLLPQWFSFPLKSVDIPKIYLRIITDLVVGRTLQIKPSLINMGSYMVRIQQQNFMHCLQHYKRLLTIVQQAEIFEQELFRYIILCQAVFGDHLAIQSYAYFSQKFPLMVNPNSMLLTYLEYLVTLLKNKPSVLLYLQAIHEFQKQLPQMFHKQKLYDISFLVQLITGSDYFRICSYSFQSLAVLYQLSLHVSDPAFLDDFRCIMQAWSSIMTPYQSKLFCYFFSFRQINNIYPFLKERQLSNPKDRIVRLWDLIGSLLDHQISTQRFLHVDANKQIVVCTEDPNAKRGVQIDILLLRNTNVEVFWSVCFQSALKQYLIRVNNNRVIVSRKPIIGVQTTEEVLKEVSYKQLKKNPEAIPFSFRLQNKQKTFEMSVCGQPLAINIQDGGIVKIAFNFKNSILLQRFIVTDLTTNSVMNHITQHFATLPNWIVKANSLAQVVSQSICNKFNFDHAYCLMGEMVKNVKQIDLGLAYAIFFRLSVKLFKSLNKTTYKMTPQMQTMITVFSVLEKALAKIRSVSQPLQAAIELDSIQKYAVPLYHLFCSALFPKRFWRNLSQQSKQKAIALFNQLLTVKSFLYTENNNIQLFEKLCILADQQEKLIGLCDILIQRHQPNDLLQLKFEHYLYWAHQNQFFRARLVTMLSGMTPYLNNINQKFSHQRNMCKQLLLQSKNIQMIFEMCPTQSKIQLLHHLTHQPYLSQKDSECIHKLKLLTQTINDPKELHQVSPWLLTVLKEMVMVQTCFKESDGLRFLIIPIILDLMVMHRGQLEQFQVQELYKRILQFLERVKGLKNPLRKVKIIAQSIFACKGLIELFVEAMCFISDRKKPQKTVEHLALKIYDQIVNCLFTLSKPVLLDFMTKFRKVCAKDAQMIVQFLSLQQLKTLKTYSLSIFLQFLLQIMILTEQGDCFTTQQSINIVDKIAKYVQSLILSESPGEKVIYYSLPKLYGQRYDTEDVPQYVKKCNKVAKKNTFELKGGIYFKTILILLRLIKLQPNRNWSTCTEMLLCGGSQSSRLSKIFQVSSNQRGSVQILMGKINQMQLKNDQTKNDDLALSPATQSQIEINSYIIDFFLMRLADILEMNSQRFRQSQIKAYSQMIVRVCSNQKITKDLSEANVYSYLILDYQQLRVNLGTGSVVSKTNTSPFSPFSPFTQQVNDRPSFEDMMEISMKLHRINSSPQRPNIRKTSVDGPQSSSKKKMEMLGYIQTNLNCWKTKCRQLQFSRFFHNRAKQIRQIELVHLNYVIMGKVQKQQSALKLRATKIINKFVVKHREDMRDQSNTLTQVQANMELKTRKVKRIFPYTCAKSPVLKVVQTWTGNMCCPFTIKMEVNQYKTKRLKHMDSIGAIFYTNNNKLSTKLNGDSQISDFFGGCPQSPLLNRKLFSIEKHYIQVQDQSVDQIVEQDLSKKHYCQWITRQGVYFCEWQLYQQGLKLISLRYRPVDDQSLWYLKLGAPIDNLIKDKTSQCSIIFQEVEEVLYRRSSQITNNSLQFFLKNNTSRFVCFYTKALLADFVKLVEQKIKKLKIVKDPSKQFADLKYTQKWSQGLLSNFDYLMLLNKYSGRTYNDPNQSYVFPWILQDYKSYSLDLSNPKFFRDLSKPMGALNKERLNSFMQKYRMLSADQKCIYRSHYSTSLFLCFYLIRLEPYSSLHRELQSKKWDVADRLFHSLDNVWQTLVADPSSQDIKECIPEFYFMPVFLRNIANIQFGIKQCGSQIDDVVLPPWASSSQQFIVTMRAALQSDYVSQRLHLWIDLIFGKHQCSEQKQNIFHPYTYSDPKVLQRLQKTNSQQMQGIISQITFFGQCPIQIFKKQHPSKRIQGQIKVSKPSSQIGGQKKSESTSTMSVSSEFSLLQGWRLVRFQIQNMEYYLQLENMMRQEKVTTSVSAMASQQIIKQSLTGFKQTQKSIKQVKKIEQIKKSQNYPRLVNHYQLHVGNQFLLDLDIHFQYSAVKTNQIWIACYGPKGIKIYNWQMKQHWKWLAEQVCDVYLQAIRMIFCTPTGKIIAYSFFDKKITQISVFKDVCWMQMRVIMLPRLPSKQKQYKNLVTYRIMCVGECKRVTMVNHSFEENANGSSYARPRNNSY